MRYGGERLGIEALLLLSVEVAFSFCVAFLLLVINGLGKITFIYIYKKT